MLGINIDTFLIAHVDAAIAVIVQNVIDAINKLLIFVFTLALFAKVHIAWVVSIDETDTEPDVVLTFLTAVDFYNHNNCVITEFGVSLGLDQLEKYSHR